MREIYHFKNHFKSDLTAASIGIHKTDWIKARNSDSKMQSHHMMKREFFDILPIVNRNNSVTHYWCTTNWGDFSCICDKPELITDANKIYYLTTIKDVIKLFATNQKNFYFLKDIDDIVGLITISHLNYKLIYLFIYELIVEVEMGLGKMILAHNKNNLYIENILNSISNPKNSKNIWDSVKRYKTDLKTGLNSNLVEYLFLRELVYVFIKFRLHIKIGFSEKNLHKIFDNIYIIRNTIAHSTRSLVHKKEDVKLMYEVIQNLEILNRRIYKYIKN